MIIALKSCLAYILLTQSIFLSINFEKLGELTGYLIIFGGLIIGLTSALGKKKESNDKDGN